MSSKKQLNLYIDTSSNEENTDVKICDICGNGIKNENHDKTHCYSIIPFLYLGDTMNAKNSHELSKLNIDTIINMTHEVKNFYPEKYNYINYAWRDSLNYHIINDLDEICDKINDLISQNKNILVHCKMGLSRSVAVILAYLIKYEHMSYYEAYEYVEFKKNTICPNDTFISDLKCFHEQYRTFN